MNQSTTNKKPEYFNSVAQNSVFFSAASLICALMVVGIHCYGAGNLEPLSVPARIEGLFSHGIFTAAVPIFFGMSGFLFFRNTCNLSDIRMKWKRRVISLGIPFIAWSSFYYFFYAIASRLLSNMTTKVDVGLLGITKGILFYEYVFPMWFMFQLIVYVIFAPLILRVLKNRKLSLVVWGGMVLLALLKIDIEIVVDGNVRPLLRPNFFIYYFVGCLCARNREFLERFIRRAMTIPIPILLLGGNGRGCGIITV